MKKVKDGYKSYEFGVIPNDWQVKKIGDIFNDLRAGSTPSRLVDRYYTGNIPWITSGELKYKTIYNTLENITEEAVKDTNLKLYPEGTFFIAITGLEAEGTRGSCAITGVPATTNQSCLAFQPKEGFSNLYLYHWYRLYGNYIGLKYTQGTKQQSLNNKIVGKLEIPVPKLEEQEKIALILSTVDEQIDNVDALIEKNKELKKGLMQTLLTKGIGHTKFKKTEIGEIPEEWEVKNLSEVVWYQEGPGLRKWQFTSAGIKVINVTNLVGNYLDLSNTSRYIDESEIEKKYKHFLIDENDIVVASSGNSWGKVSVVRKIDLPLLMNTSVIRFKPMEEERLSSKYLLQFLKSDAFKKQIALLITGSAQPNFGPYHLDRTKIATPNINEQLRIASILSEVDKKIEEYENKKQKLEELKKGLMQKLLTGSIRVF